MNRSTFIIGTNGYHEFILNLLNSLDLQAIERSSHEFIVLTDSPSDVLESEVYRQLSNQIKVAKVEPYGWPEATLFRFKLMLEHWDIASNPFVGYLDADCLIRDTKRFLNGPDLSDESLIYFVAHPGYFKSPLWKRLAIASPVRGVFETRKSSEAFVPFRRRFGTYVCGGHWFGGREPIRRMLEDLDYCVERDLQKDIVARFHDESHVNRFLQNAKVELLTPEWAYSPSHGSFRTDCPIVEVVEKDEKWFDSRAVDRSGEPCE